MDGVDLACCEFSYVDTGWSYEFLAADTLPYPPPIKKKLVSACNWPANEIEELNNELGRFYAELLNDFHSFHKLSPDLISSHGHTILHEPEKGITLQAGHGGIIAEMTGITVVNDFRSADVAQGGQGAPLVPVGDKFLFGDYDTCLNLGGFANISFDNIYGQRIAYDLCPANMALNWIAGLRGLEFDKGGAMAKQGKVVPELLLSLNSLDYYRVNPPKSLGREWFLERILPLIDDQHMAAHDLMATMVEHIVQQLDQGIKAAESNLVLVTGGGALNQTLMERFKSYTSAQVEIPGIQLVQFKEALVFAFLGLLRFRVEINCLSSVTGGKQDLSTGTIFRPNKT